MFYSTPKYTLNTTDSLFTALGGQICKQAPRSHHHSRRRKRQSLLSAPQHPAPVMAWPPSPVQCWSKYSKSTFSERTGPGSTPIASKSTATRKSGPERSHYPLRNHRNSMRSMGLHQSTIELLPTVGGWQARHRLSRAIRSGNSPWRLGLSPVSH
jgi:hypothetical protein